MLPRYGLYHLPNCVASSGICSYKVAVLFIFNQMWFGVWQNEITALMLATKYGHLSIVQYLVGQGAQLEATDVVRNPLCLLYYCALVVLYLIILRYIHCLYYVTTGPAYGPVVRFCSWSDTDREVFVGPGGILGGSDCGEHSTHVVACYAYCLTNSILISRLYVIRL